jgi:ComF family protein
MGISLLSTTTWQRRAQQALSLFLDHACPVCERPTSASLCESCERQLQRHQLAHPLTKSQHGLTVISWGTYEGHLKRGIATLKYSKQVELSQFLGFQLGHTWLGQTTGHPRQSALSPVVIPIPLHAERHRQRGFNQAELLAQWFCHSTHLPLMADGLLRVQATQPQHRLNQADRQKNLSQAFAVNRQKLPQLQRSSVWLLDDIFTTGATVHSAAQTLRRYRISVAGVCTVARAMLQAPCHS